MNKKIVIVILIIVLLIALFLVGYSFWKYQNPDKGGLSIDSTQTSQIYIDDIPAGRTPFEQTRKPGEVVVKIIPQNTKLTPYQTRVNIVSGVTSVIRVSFGSTDEDRSGVVLSFEKISGNQSALGVVSDPDAAQVSLDGTVKGFTPYKNSNLIPGEHEVTLLSDGFMAKTYQIKTYPGYKLSAIFKLAKAKPMETPIPSPTPNPVTFIEILDTPTKFLRVRSAASSASNEIGTVKPGEKYPLVEEVKEWFRIKYQEAQMDQPAKEGWVSSKYSRKIENDGAFAVLSPLPTQ